MLVDRVLEGLTFGDVAMGASGSEGRALLDAATEAGSGADAGVVRVSSSEPDATMPDVVQSMDGAIVDAFGGSADATISGDADRRDDGGATAGCSCLTSTRATPNGVAVLVAGVRVAMAALRPRRRARTSLRGVQSR